MLYKKRAVHDWYKLEKIRAVAGFVIRQCRETSWVSLLYWDYLLCAQYNWSGKNKLKCAYVRIRWIFTAHGSMFIWLAQTARVQRYSCIMRAVHDVHESFLRSWDRYRWYWLYWVRVLVGGGGVLNLAFIIWKSSWSNRKPKWKIYSLGIHKISNRAFCRRR